MSHGFIGYIKVYITVLLLVGNHLVYDMMSNLDSNSQRAAHAALVLKVFHPMIQYKTAK